MSLSFHKFLCSHVVSSLNSTFLMRWDEKEGRKRGLSWTTIFFLVPSFYLLVNSIHLFKIFFWYVSFIFNVVLFLYTFPLWRWRRILFCFFNQFKKEKQNEIIYSFFFFHLFLKCFFFLYLVVVVAHASFNCFSFLSFSFYFCGLIFFFFVIVFLLFWIYWQFNWIRRDFTFIYRNQSLCPVETLLLNWFGHLLHLLNNGEFFLNNKSTRGNILDGFIYTRQGRI